MHLTDQGVPDVLIMHLVVYGVKFNIYPYLIECKYKNKWIGRMEEKFKESKKKTNLFKISEQMRRDNKMWQEENMSKLKKEKSKWMKM